MAGDAKIDIICQYLHDHSRLVCNELNKKAGYQVWKTTPLTDSMRRNLIFHYGNSGFKSPEKVHAEAHRLPPKSPVMIDPEAVGLNEDIIKFAAKKPIQKKRLTIRKQINTTTNGIFSNPIQSKLIEIVQEPSPKNQSHHVTQPLTVSTSSIYADNTNSQSDYEHELFQEPSDLEMASFYHNQQQNSQWFQEHSFVRHPEDDSNWLCGSLDFNTRPRPKTRIKIHSQPF